jgi:hypothetical protein
MSVFSDIVEAIRRLVRRNCKPIDYLRPMTLREAEEAVTAAAKAQSEPLDPLESIVDLQKAIGRDSSPAARKALWGEFELHGEYTGTAEQNRTLHRCVMEAIAAHDV